MSNLFTLPQQWLEDHESVTSRASAAVISARDAAPQIRRRALFSFNFVLGESGQPKILELLCDQIARGDDEVPVPLAIGTRVSVAFISAALPVKSRKWRRSVHDLAAVAANHAAFPLVIRSDAPALSMTGLRVKHQPWFLLCSVFGCSEHDSFFSGSSRPPPISAAPVMPPFPFATGAMVRKGQRPKKKVVAPKKRVVLKEVEEEEEEAEKVQEPTTTEVVELSGDESEGEPTLPASAPAIAVPQKKGAPPVDSACNLSNVRVHVDEEGAWACMLNQTNIGGNNNKFYVIQLLEDVATGTTFTVWTRWGRVGERGQSAALSVGKNLSAGKAGFRKKFKEKTVNEWLAPFVARPGKYTLLEMDNGGGDDEGADGALPVASSSSAPSALLPQVQSVVRLIFDMKQMESTAHELGLDTKKAPLGKLSKEQIRRGHEVLREIEAAMNRGAAKEPELALLSSKFYTLIPHDFGRARPPVIGTKELLKSKIDLLEALADIEIATGILKETAGSVDENFKRLHADMVPLPEGSREFSLIAKYLSATHPGKTPTIKTVFTLDREGERERFESSKGNRMLLWHGSRLTNFAGIISQGLRIAPPEAPVTGYRFGKGIYFADLAQTSVQYTHAAPGSEFLMLLVDVALGNVAELPYDQYMEHALPGTDSSKALGKVEPDRSQWVTMDDGVVVPCGKPVEAQRLDVSCTENEFVVYSVSQARIRFLLHLVMP